MQGAIGETEASHPACRPDTSSSCYTIGESATYTPRDGRPCSTLHSTRPLPCVDSHAQWTACAAHVDPNEGCHPWAARCWHPDAASSHTPAISQSCCSTFARSGGEHGLRAPRRARVPAVKATMGTRSNLSCCSSHTPTIYKENRDKGAKPAA